MSTDTNLESKFKFSEYVSSGIKTKGIKNKWLADNLHVSESSFSYKIKNDTFTIAEILKISEILDINLGHVQEEYRQFIKEVSENHQLESETLEIL